MSFIVTKFAEGGIFMWPILICSIVGFTIAGERMLVLYRASRVEKEHLLYQLRSKILAGQLGSAIAVVNAVNLPLTKILSAGLTSVANNGTPDEIQTSMDAMALREIPKLEKRIALISTCANVATLLGLLGTVAGLIGAFDAVANVAPDKKAEMLASAIASAMNTTAGGLLGAIPLLALFGYLSSQAQELIDDIHEASVFTLNFIITQRSRIMSADAAKLRPTGE